MCAGNHAGLARESAQILGPAAVEAFAIVEHEPTHGSLLDAVKCLTYDKAGDVLFTEFLNEFLLHLILEGVTRCLTLELGLDEKCIGDSVTDDRLGLSLNLGLDHARSEFALWLADRFTQFLLRGDDRGDRFLTELQCGEEVSLREFIRRSLEHDHVLFVSDVNEVEVARLHLSMGRVGDKLALDTTDAHRPDRAGERQVTDHQCRGGAVDREDVRVVIPVCTQQQSLDLHLVKIALGKQRADRSIRDAAGENFLLRGTPLTLEEAAGETPGCGSFLAIIDREREKVEARPGFGGAASGDENDGFP